MLIVEQIVAFRPDVVKSMANTCWKADSFDFVKRDDEEDMRRAKSSLVIEQKKRDMNILNPTQSTRSGRRWAIKRMSARVYGESIITNTVAANWIEITTPRVR